MALEYVDGQPLDEYCNSRALSIDARLKLLLQVAEAMAFAHSRLVVHRDLKPGNMLVTADGQVRLLDFGIAKLMEGDSARETALTQVSGRALTLDYASPEQIRASRSAPRATCTRWAWSRSSCWPARGPIDSSAAAPPSSRRRSPAPMRRWRARSPSTRREGAAQGRPRRDPQQGSQETGCGALRHHRRPGAGLATLYGRAAGPRAAGHAALPRDQVRTPLADTAVCRGACHCRIRPCVGFRCDGIGRPGVAYRLGSGALAGEPCACAGAPRRATGGAGSRSAGLPARTVPCKRRRPARSGSCPLDNCARTSRHRRQAGTRATRARSGGKGCRAFDVGGNVQGRRPRQGVGGPCRRAGRAARTALWTGRSTPGRRTCRPGERDRRDERCDARSKAARTCPPHRGSRTRRCGRTETQSAVHAGPGDALYRCRAPRSALCRTRKR